MVTQLWAQGFLSAGSRVNAVSTGKERGERLSEIQRFYEAASGQVLDLKPAKGAHVFGKALRVAQKSPSADKPWVVPVLPYFHQLKRPHPFHPSPLV